jgi:hypothetical protein
MRMLRQLGLVAVLGGIVWGVLAVGRSPNRTDLSTYWSLVAGVVAAIAAVKKPRDACASSTVKPRPRNAVNDSRSHRYPTCLPTPVARAEGLALHPSRIDAKNRAPARNCYKNTLWDRLQRRRCVDQ